MKLEAVFEGGVLRPTEPLRLAEHEHVSLLILDTPAVEEQLRFAPREEFEALADYALSRETVRKALSQIPGSLDADFAAERSEP